MEGERIQDSSPSTNMPINHPNQKSYFYWNFKDTVFLRIPLKYSKKLKTPFWESRCGAAAPAFPKWGLLTKHRYDIGVT